MPNALGSWSHAPLGYVLAAVNISHTGLLDSHLSQMHEALAQRLPELHQGVQGAVAIARDGAQFQGGPYWEFVSENEGNGAILKPTLIVVHATEYANYEAFRDLIADVLRAFSRVAPATMALRVGLRYVDFIVPTEGESADEYVDPRMRGVALEDFQGLDTQTRSRSVRRIDERSALTVTYSRMNTEPGQLPMPEDLSLYKLKPSGVLLRSLDYKGQIGTLDIDRWEQLREKFSADALLDRFDRLHVDHSKTVRKIATGKALTTWGASDAG